MRQAPYIDTIPARRIGSPSHMSHWEAFWQILTPLNIITSETRASGVAGSTTPRGIPSRLDSCIHARTATPRRYVAVTLVAAIVAIAARRPRPPLPQDQIRARLADPLARHYTACTQVVKYEYFGIKNSTRGGNRTHTTLRPTDFESVASTVPPPGQDAPI